MAKSEDKIMTKKIIESVLHEFKEYKAYTNLSKSQYATVFNYLNLSLDKGQMLKLSEFAEFTPEGAYNLCKLIEERNSEENHMSTQGESWSVNPDWFFNFFREAKRDHVDFPTLDAQYRALKVSDSSVFHYLDHKNWNIQITPYGKLVIKRKAAKKRDEESIGLDYTLEELDLFSNFFKHAAKINKEHIYGEESND